MRRFVHRAILGVSAASLAATALVASAQASTPSWHIVHTDGNLNGPGRDGMGRITAINAHDVWAPGGSTSQHWDGKNWTKVPLPDVLRAPHQTGALSQIAASSSSNVWAFGFSSPSGTATRSQYAFRWNHGHWTVAHKWTTWNWISDAVVLSPTDVWVFGGGSVDSNDFGTWHYNGKTWSRLGTSGPRPMAVSALSAGDIWAVGAALTPNDFDGRYVTHWNGHRWTKVDTPNIQDIHFETPRYQAVYAESPKSVWIVGGRYATVQGKDVEIPIVLHWNGKAWQHSEGPVRDRADELTSVVPDGTGGIWTTRNGEFDGEVMHMSHGVWTVAPLPHVKNRTVVVWYLTRVPHTNAFWGSGELDWGGYPNMNGIALRYP